MGLFGITTADVMAKLQPSVGAQTFRIGDSLSVSSITRSGGTATVTTASAHGFVVGLDVVISGANQSEYNGRVQVTALVGTTGFRFAVDSGAVTPATGTMSVLGADLSAAECERIIATMEDRVVSQLPTRYQALMTAVDGELAVRCAAEGQTTFTASLRPLVAGSLRVYVNYPKTRAWSERELGDWAEPEAAFTVNNSTGLVTMAEPLKFQDRVAIAYQHQAAAGFLWLKDCALSFVCVEIARRFAFFSSADGFNQFQQWETTAVGFLRDMGKTQRPGVPGLDAIELVTETRRRSIGEGL